MNNNHDQHFEYTIGGLLIHVASNENSNCISTNENLNCNTTDCSMNLDAKSSKHIESEIHYTNMDNPNINTQPISNYPSSPAIVQNNECSVYNLVKHWYLEKIYPILTENDIDITALKYMGQHHIEKLLFSCTMGIKIKFERFLMQLQKEQGTYIETNLTSNTETTLADSSSLLISPKKKSSGNINATLQDILNLSVEEENFIKLSKEHQILSDASRSILINVLVNFYIQKNLHMGVKECETLSRQIITLFPEESEGVYFQRRPKSKPKGQLYDRYNNYISKLRQNDFLPKVKRFKAQELYAADEGTPEENAEQVCQYLKYNRDDTDEKLIMKKWEETVVYRKHTIRGNRDKTIQHILEEWPAYTQVYGPKLINLDFDFLYPEATTLFIQVDKFVNEVIYLFKDKLSDPSCKKLFKEFQQQRNTTIDTKNCIAFYLLHGLLRPTNKKCRIVDNKKTWNKFTILDSQNSFMIFARTAQECENIIEIKKCTAVTEKNTVQPFVFVVGVNEFAPVHFYVYMDGIKYKLPSVVSAIDCAFKIFHIFNIKYPEESVSVWLFIQKYLYNVKTVYDPVFPSVDLFISRLKK